MMDKNAKIYVAGHRGMVGSAIVRELQRQGYNNIITRTHKELDLCRQENVEKFFAEEKPEYVFLAAAKVGGIVANQEALADFMWFNMTLEMNVIHSAWQNGCKKLEFLGSSCIYPRMAPQPMKESCLLTSELEKTNEAYALAKISGLKYCEFLNRQYGTDYISVMPTNLYGPGDNFNLETSHVLPAMIRKVHLAKALMEGDMAEIRRDLDRRPVEGTDGNASASAIVAILEKYGIMPGVLRLWGTGTPVREFLWSRDMADASVYVLENIDFDDVRGTDPEVRNCHINIGSGVEHTIAETAALVAKSAGYNGRIEWDSTKPDGTMRKLCDVTKIHNLGWRHTVELEEGIDRLTRWYLES